MIIGLHFDIGLSTYQSLAVHYLAPSIPFSGLTKVQASLGRTSLCATSIYIYIYIHTSVSMQQVACSVQQYTSLGNNILGCWSLCTTSQLFSTLLLCSNILFSVPYLFVLFGKCYPRFHVLLIIDHSNKSGYRTTWVWSRKAEQTSEIVTAGFRL